MTLAYENASDVDSDKTSDVDVDEAREDLDPEPLRPVPLSLDLKVRFPEWDSDWSDKERERESPTKITPRIRAISIPATPTMAHIQTVSVLDAASLAHSDDIIRSTAFFCRVMMDDCILRTQPMHFFDLLTGPILFFDL